MNLMSIMCADAQGQERILAFFLEVTCPKSPRNRKKHITGTAMLSAILSECGVVAYYNMDHLVCLGRSPPKGYRRRSKVPSGWLETIQRVQRHKGA